MAIYSSTGESYETPFDRTAARLEQTSEGYPYYQVADARQDEGLFFKTLGHGERAPNAELYNAYQRQLNQSPTQARDSVINSNILGSEGELKTKEDVEEFWRENVPMSDASPEPLFPTHYAMFRKKPITDPVATDPLSSEIERAGSFGRTGSPGPGQSRETRTSPTTRPSRMNQTDWDALIRENREHLESILRRMDRPPADLEQRPDLLPEAPSLKSRQPASVDFDKLKASLKLKEKNKEEFHWMDSMWIHPGDRGFELTDSNTGKGIGFISLNEQNKGKTLYVNYVHADPIGGPNSLGQLIRPLVKQVKEMFPNAEKITGLRISGARKKAREEAEKAGSDKYVDPTQTIWLKKPKGGEKSQFFIPESGEGNWPWSQVDSDTSSTFTSLGATMQEATAQAQDPTDRILQSYKINPKAWEDWLANSPMSENIEDRRGETGQDAIGDLIRGILDNPQFAMRRPTLSDPLTTEIDKTAAGMSIKGVKGSPFWNDEKISKAVELRGQGLNLKQITDELGGTVGSLSSALTRRGLSLSNRPEWTTGKVRRAKEMFEEGKLLKEISEEVGLSSKTVSQKVKEQGWERAERIPEIPESVKDKFNRLILEEWKKLMSKERPND